MKREEAVVFHGQLSKAYFDSLTFVIMKRLLPALSIVSEDDKKIMFQ